MPSIAELAVQLTAHTGRFRAGMKEASGILGTFSSASRLALSAFNPLATALIGGASAGAAAYFIKQQGDAVEKLGTQSDRLNMSTENLAAMQLGAEKANLAFEDLTGGMNNFQKTIAKANSGDRESILLLRQMGLNAAQLSNMDMSDAVGKAADQIGKLGNANDRLLASTLLFGKQGGTMLDFLKNGSAGINDMRTRAEALGYSFSRIDSEQISRANNAFTDLRYAVAAVGGKLAIDFAPLIEMATNKLVDMGNQGTPMADRIVSGVDWIIRSFARMDNVWREMKMGIGEVALMLIGLIKRVYTLGDKLKSNIGIFGGVGAAAAKLGGSQTDMEKFFKSLDDDAAAIKKEIHDIGQGVVDADKLSPFQQAFADWKTAQRAAAAEAVAGNSEVGASLDGLLDKYKSLGSFKQVSLGEAASINSAMGRGAYSGGVNVHGLTSLGRDNQVRDPQLSTTNQLLGRIVDNTSEQGAFAT